MRAKGHKQDRTDQRDFDQVELIGDIAEQTFDYPVPEWGDEAPRSDLMSYVGDMWDQQNAQACVGFALARATHMRGLIQGFKGMEPPSPYAFWALARMFEKQLTQPLDNSGCYPRDACKMAQKWGLAPWSKWPSLPQYMNVAPTPDMLRASAKYKASSYYSLNAGDAPTRLSLIRKSLTARVPVCVAFMVDDTFEGFQGSHVMPNFDGTFRGSHYVTIIGHDEDAFLICNSWGGQWGFGGFAWVTADRVANPYTTDLRAVLVAPDLEEA